MHHVLLLEDDAPLRSALFRGLHQPGELELVAVGSLSEAVRTLDVLPPNLVISDLDLPDGTGLDLLPELAERGLRVPVVIITAHLGRFGAQLPTSPNIEVLPKPFAPEALKAVVTQRLQSSELPSPAFAVADYLQLAGMARRSVRLAVRQGQEALGEIVVQDGEPRWAVDQQGEGEAAFARLALLPRAEVSCEALTAPFAQANLSGSLERLLIDAARHADEAQRHGSVSRQAAAPRAGSGQYATATSPASVTPPGGSPLPPPPPVRAARPPLPPRPAPQPSAAPSSSKLPSQEKPVNPIKPNNRIPQLLQLDSSLKAGARADRHGSVIEAVGELDAETAAAVATMAARELAEAAAELGFGRPNAWQLSLGTSTWYVALGRDELVITQGGINKNPGVTLRKLAKSSGVSS
jgi:CheY-like chemotaxis protein